MTCLLSQSEDRFLVLVLTVSFHCCRIFLSLMEAAGLTDLLKQEGDFTLFAPTDEAFAGLSERDLSLLKSESFVIFKAHHI